MISELFFEGSIITVLLIRREIIRIRSFIQGIIHQKERIRGFNTQPIRLNIFISKS